MNFFGFRKRREAHPGTAPIARERLQVLLTHERATNGQPNKLGALRDDIINTIMRHVSIAPEEVKVRVERRNSVSILRVAVDLPA